jgi:hypothetical protein
MLACTELPFWAPDRVAARAASITEAVRHAKWRYLTLVKRFGKEEPGKREKVLWHNLGHKSEFYLDYASKISILCLT